MGAFGTSDLILLTLPARDGNNLDPVILAAAYDLTPAETKVALAINSGLVVKAIAANQRVTEDAIRFHVKSLLRKTGASTQRDLAVLLRSVDLS